MRQMDIKMIVTDIDGTLLKTDKSMSEFTRIVLEKCRERGIKLVYATGRGVTAERVASSELFDGKITMNGAIAKINDDVVYSRTIPYQVARPFLTACNERGIKMLWEFDGMCYANFTVSDIWQEITRFQIVDFSQNVIDMESIYSINLSSEEKIFIEQLLPDDLYLLALAVPAGFLVQIMHKDASKSKAAYALSNYWGIKQFEIAGWHFTSFYILK